MDAAHAVYSLDRTYKYPAGITTPAAYAQTAQREYVPRGMVHATEICRTTLFVPANNPQKPYEYVTGITDQSSNAWKLLHGKGVKYDDDGTISIAGYKCAALGSKYGKIGDRFDVQLESGTWLRIIKADCKQDRHTISGYTGRNGHILEMIVWSVPDNVQMYGSYDVLPAYKGKIVKIYKEKTHESSN